MGDKWAMPPDDYGYGPKTPQRRATDKIAQPGPGGAPQPGPGGATADAPRYEMPPDDYGYGDSTTEKGSGFLAGAADVFTGSRRRTKETEGLSELAAARGVTSGDFTNDLKVAAGLMFVASDEAKKDIIRENFPGVKIKADKYGTEVITFPDGRKVVLNKPGLSFQDIYAGLGDLAAFYGPNKLVGLGKSALARIGIGAVGAGATQAALEKSAQAIGSKQEVDPVNVGIATVLGGGSEIVGAGAKAIKDRNLTKRLGVAAEDIAELGRIKTSVKEADDLTKKTGIRLFRAQKTGSLTDLERQSYVASLPGADRKALDELSAQSKEAYDAVTNIMDMLGPAEAVETAAERTRDAARMTVEAQKTIRKEAASPLYKKAFLDKTEYEVPNTVKLISELTEDLPKGGETYRTLKKINGFITPEEGDVLRLKRLHRAKLEIDQMLSKFGDNSLGNTTKRDVIAVKTELLKELDELNPDYKEARRVFAEQSPAVENIEKSIIGKISKFEDPQFKQVVAKLFDTAENKSIIVKSKRLIERSDPQAWRDITRSYFETGLGKIGADATEETAQNIPGQIYRQFFKNKKKRELLFAAIGENTEAGKSTKYLQRALEKSMAGRLGGSQTAHRMIFEKELRGGIGETLKKFFTPVKSVTDIGADAEFRMRSKALGAVMFDPKWGRGMKELRQINPGTPKAGRRFESMLQREIKDLAKTSPQILNPDRE